MDKSGMCGTPGIEIIVVEANVSIITIKFIGRLVSSHCLLVQLAVFKIVPGISKHCNHASIYQSTDWLYMTCLLVQTSKHCLMTADSAVESTVFKTPFFI